MKKLLPPMWIAATGICVVFILAAYLDIKKGDIGTFLIDIAFILWWFTIAHYSWERNRNEK